MRSLKIAESKPAAEDALSFAICIGVWCLSSSSPCSTPLLLMLIWIPEGVTFPPERSPLSRDGEGKGEWKCSLIAYSTLVITHLEERGTGWWGRCRSPRWRAGGKGMKEEESGIDTPLGDLLLASLRKGQTHNSILCQTALQLHHLSTLVTLNLVA